MCATCWAQGLLYAGGAVGGLRIAAARARRRRVAAADDPWLETPDQIEATDSNEATEAAVPTPPARELVETASPPG